MGRMEVKIIYTYKRLRVTDDETMETECDRGGDMQTGSLLSKRKRRSTLINIY